MRGVLTVSLVIFMLAIPPLVPVWTASATLVVAMLELLCGSVLVAMWWTSRAVPALRVGATVVALIFVLAAVDQLRAAVASGTPIIGGKTPIVGLVVIGVPCAIFAIRGLPTPDEVDLEGHPEDGDEGFDGFDEDDAEEPGRRA
jgi:hypothetical protein